MTPSVVAGGGGGVGVFVSAVGSQMRVQNWDISEYPLISHMTDTSVSLGLPRLIADSSGTPQKLLEPRRRELIIRTRQLPQSGKCCLLEKESN